MEGRGEILSFLANFKTISIEFLGDVLIDCISCTSDASSSTITSETEMGDFDGSTSP